MLAAMPVESDGFKKYVDAQRDPDPTMRQRFQMGIYSSGYISPYYWVDFRIPYYFWKKMGV